MKKIIFSFLLIIIAISFQTNSVFAHPGRTDSSGCHTCRTNCPSWGLSYGEYHCHGGSSAPSYSNTPSYTNTNCPSNSTYSSTEKSCICGFGYTPSLNKLSCVKIPEHAHAVESKTDVWLCDDGYTEYKNTCIPIPAEDCEIDNFNITISRVVDGDTVEFTCNGKDEKIRIIGIDTPETVHPSKPVQCFGKEASQKMKKIAENKKAILKKGQGSENRDKYGRLLRYIEINNQDIGAEMIKNGYAFSYKIYPHEKLDEYNQLEKDVRETEKGLWGKGICDYQDEKIDNTENNVVSTQQQNQNNLQESKQESILNKLINFLKSLFK
ncbi:MAG: thermonuclease family protein [Patescibacteria group bacterium]